MRRHAGQRAADRDNGREVPSWRAAGGGDRADQRRHGRLGDPVGVHQRRPADGRAPSHRASRRGPAAAPTTTRRSARGQTSGASSASAQACRSEDGGSWTVRRPDRRHRGARPGRPARAAGRRPRRPTRWRTPPRRRHQRPGRQCSTRSPGPSRTPRPPPTPGSRIARWVTTTPLGAPGRPRGVHEVRRVVGAGRPWRDGVPAGRGALTDRAQQPGRVGSERKHGAARRDGQGVALDRVGRDEEDGRADLGEHGREAGRGWARSSERYAAPACTAAAMPTTKPANGRVPGRPPGQGRPRGRGGGRRGRRRGRGARRR